MMPTLQKNGRQYIILLLCCIPLFFLNVHNSHSCGGDDYAQYIKEAKNISEGRPFYITNYVFNKANNIYAPPQYPPGFPLLIAPVVRIWGIALEPLCYFNCILGVLLMLGFFTYFRKYMGVFAAVCLSVIISYSGTLIYQKQYVLSDVPNMFFILLYLIARSHKTFPWPRILLLVLLATMAMLIRTQSVVLIAAEAAYLLLVVIKDWRQQRAFPIKLLATTPSLYIVGGSMLLLLFLNKMVFYCPTSASGFYADFVKQALQRGVLATFKENIGFLFDATRSFFHYDTLGGIPALSVKIMEYTGLILSIAGFIYTASRRLCFDDVFFVCSCGLMLVYSVHDARFFLPVLVIVYLYSYNALKFALQLIPKIRLQYVAVAITVICLLSGYQYMRATTRTPLGFVPEAADYQAFSYLSQHVSDTDLILCPGPRLLTLYTNRRCMIFAWQLSPEDNKKVCDSMHVKYVLTMKGIANDFFHAYLQVAHPTDSLSIADGYMLYTVK